MARATVFGSIVAKIAATAAPFTGPRHAARDARLAVAGSQARPG
jgi:hypothetical protein